MPDGCKTKPRVICSRLNAFNKNSLGQIAYLISNKKAGFKPAFCLLSAISYAKKPGLI
jgi:hypothetical protein